jgi:hypothetical protein
MKNPFSASASPSMPKPMAAARASFDSDRMAAEHEIR